MPQSIFPNPKSEANRVWFITGCSGGFGRLLAEEVLKAGGKVIATARNVGTITDLEQKYPHTARALSLDVTHKQQICTVAEQALEHFGHIDVLVNNAGYGLVGAVEEPTDEEIKREVDTNVYGVVHVTRAFLPHLRARKAGHIINLSSIAGIASTPGLGYYNLTKFAVEGLSEALYQELLPLGVHVTLIEPGPFRTDFLGRSGVIAENIIPEYVATAGNARKYFSENDGKQPGDPLKAIHAMMQITQTPNPPLRLLLGKAAFNRAKTKIEWLQKDATEWEAITLGADFPEGQ